MIEARPDVAVEAEIVVMFSNLVESCSGPDAL